MDGQCRAADLLHLPDAPFWLGRFVTVSSGRKNCFVANMQYTSLVRPTFIRLGCTISVFAIN